MSGFLLDTNVISEMTKSEPSPRIVEFLAEHEDLWLSAVVLHELEFGLQLLPVGRRRNSLRTALSGMLANYGGRILSVDEESAVWAARFRAEAHRSGRQLELGDALIAGTAKANDLSVATRNVSDFGYLDIEVVNPWAG